MNISKSDLKKLDLPQVSNMVSWGIEVIEEKVADLKATVGNVCSTSSTERKQHKPAEKKSNKSKSKSEITSSASGFKETITEEQL